MFYAKLFLTFIFSLNLLAQDSKLPKLSTKQDVTNLRFLSIDGKYTYYQRRSGALVFATNFKVFDAIKNEIGTHYNIISNRHKEKLLVSANTTQFTFLEPRVSKKIYVLNYGEPKAVEIGKGNNPQLHLKNKWASFYDSYERKLHFVNITNPALRYSIKLPSKPNPYFLPSAHMVDSRNILYIDQNEKGVYGIIKFDRSTKKSTPLFKLKDPFSRLEICSNDKDIFIGSFSLHTYEKGSEIFRVKDPSNFKKFELESIYSSSLSDFGHMICDLEDQKIYFIKTINKNGITELASLDYKAQNKKDKKDEKVKILSDLKYISQIIEMDGKLLIPFRGDFYVPLGENNYANIDSLSDIKKKNIKKSPTPTETAPPKSLPNTTPAKKKTPPPATNEALEVVPPKLDSMKKN